MQIAAVGWMHLNLVLNISLTCTKYSGLLRRIEAGDLYYLPQPGICSKQVGHVSNVRHVCQGAFPVFSTRNFCLLLSIRKEKYQASLLIKKETS